MEFGVEIIGVRVLLEALYGRDFSLLFLSVFGWIVAYILFLAMFFFFENRVNPLVFRV